MGKQAKLKAQRREIRKRRKEAVQKHLVSPPDLGVQVAEVINTKDKFGG